MKVGVDPQRAKAIGRMLFQKYDLGKRGALGPKQCYQIFSDFCYRILVINPQPTMQEANSMYQVLDQNKDQKVTQVDFENLAVKYLCGSSGGFGNFSTSRATSQTSQAYSQSKVTNQTNLQTSTVTKYVNHKQPESRNLTNVAKRRLDVARRLFKMFDKDNSGDLTEQEVPFIIQETYKEMGQQYQPSAQDVKSYMKMVDRDSNGKITLDEFEQIILRSLKNAGFQIYE